MPHVLAVRCPKCSALARFEFAELARIRLREDIAYFEKSRDFEYVKLEDHGGGYFNAAIYYYGLSRRDPSTIEDLPGGYEPGEWQHSRFARRSHGGDRGSLLCGACGLRRKHTLAWPDDAFFQIAYRGKVLWAFNRDSALELLAYVRSEDRNRGDFRYGSFLMKVPALFLSRKARPSVVKRLEAILCGTTSSDLAEP